MSYDGPPKVSVTGIALRVDGVDGADLVVEIEVPSRPGLWIEVIRERGPGPISHIVEVGGMHAALRRVIPEPRS